MEALSYLMEGFGIATTAANLLYCLIGVTMGMFVGVMPGLGSVAGTAMLIPVTFGMDATSAIIMLAGIYYGCEYGGIVTAVLINTPGESSSVFATLDGYALTKQGRAGVALGVAAIGSFVGGTVAIIGLTFIAPVLSRFALRFGPPETFAIMILGLSMLIGVVGKSLLKGVMAAIFGFLLALVGDDPISGVVRNSFGIMNLVGGFELVPIAMGLFGISEVVMGMTDASSSEKPATISKLLPERHEWGPVAASIGRGTLIGFATGVLPGANTMIASFLSYSTERQIAKDPSRFGKGALEGIAGPETANNACAGAANIPLFTLGIPSSPTIAVLLGAFMMHGLVPGPKLFAEHPQFVWGVIASFYIGNVILVIMNLPLARFWALVAKVPFKLLFPFIVTFCIIGAFGSANRMFDVWVMLVFGIIGYILKKMDFPLAAIILTFVLAKPIESTFVQSLLMSRGSLAIFFQRPISRTILIFVGIIIVLSVFSAVKGKRDHLASDIE